MQPQIWFMANSVVFGLLDVHYEMDFCLRSHERIQRHKDSMTSIKYKKG